MSGLSKPPHIGPLQEALVAAAPEPQAFQVAQGFHIGAVHQDVGKGKQTRRSGIV